MKNKFKLMLLCWSMATAIAWGQGAPDVATLNWLADQRANIKGTSLLTSVLLVPDFVRGDEMWIYVPAAIDRQQFSKQFFNMTELRFITPPVEKVGEELFRIDLATLPPGDYTVYLRYRDQLETRRMRFLTDRSR